MGYNSNNNQNNNEIKILKNELTKANKIIEQQKTTIIDLQNKLNNYNTTINNLNNDINNYKNIIIQKDAELNNLRTQLNIIILFQIKFISMILCVLILYHLIKMSIMLLLV